LTQNGIVFPARSTEASSRSEPKAKDTADQEEDSKGFQSRFLQNPAFHLLFLF